MTGGRGQALTSKPPPFAPASSWATFLTLMEILWCVQFCVLLLSTLIVTFVSAMRSKHRNIWEKRKNNIGKILAYINILALCFSVVWSVRSTQPRRGLGCHTSRVSSISRVSVPVTCAHSPLVALLLKRIYTYVA